MPSALIILILAAAIPGHRDWSQIPKQCESCHAGHGISGMKLAPVWEPDLCLRCHGGPSHSADMVKKGYLSPSSKPEDVNQEMGMPYTHNGLQSCSVCHAGHGVITSGYIPGSGPKPGTRKTNQWEHELCGGCHSSNPIYQAPASFHSVVSLPKSGTFPSLKPGNMGAQTWVNCSDCHGVSDVTLPPGVHASANPGLLKLNDTVVDGQEESSAAYAQCYACHDRSSILQNESFPLHRTHIVDGQTSCYTCHDSHASPTLPHLLAFEEDNRSNRITPDGSGRKSFVQTGERAGVCYLNCHHVEHDGWSYGPASALRKNGRPLVLQPGKTVSPAAGTPVRK
jgi:predicted CXXCH cytochrome family protein